VKGSRPDSSRAAAADGRAPGGTESPRSARAGGRAGSGGGARLRPDAAAAPGAVSPALAVGAPGAPRGQRPPPGYAACGLPTRAPGSASASSRRRASRRRPAGRGPGPRAPRDPQPASSAWTRRGPAIGPAPGRLPLERMATAASRVGARGAPAGRAARPQARGAAGAGHAGALGAGIGKPLVAKLWSRAEPRAPGRRAGRGVSSSAWGRGCWGSRTLLLELPERTAGRGQSHARQSRAIARRLRTQLPAGPCARVGKGLARREVGADPCDRTFNPSGILLKSRGEQPLHITPPRKKVMDGIC
jgi:hypothetical protein